MTPKATKTRPLWWELAGIFGLICLFAFCLVTSWRKWPDPIVDFGIQLYTPWRMAHGDILYRDLFFLYGPLSQHFNAALFYIFGTSLTVLVMADLAIFVGILVSTYFLFRAAWGVGGALVAVAVFIAVFGFSEFTAIGNYNYATPYSHETTHGLLVCLLLVLILARWVETATLRLSFCAGLLFGLTFLLKPEIVLAGGLSLFVAGAWRFRFGGLPPLRSLATMAFGAILPTAAFVFYFCAFMPWPQAIASACHGWLVAVTSTRFTGSLLQRRFLGLDGAGSHFLLHALATLGAVLLFGFIAAVGWQVDRLKRPAWRWPGIVALAALLVWLAVSGIDWIECGRCLPGLVLIYLAICLADFFRKRETAPRRTQVIRLMLAVLALAFLLRMILNSRIYHFGYYQAALAAILVPAMLIGELPERTGFGRVGRTAIVVGTLALFIPGVTILLARSQQILTHHTTVVTTGGDTFIALSPPVESIGTVVETVRKDMQTTSPGQTLLVLPQGLMLNYLLRMPAPPLVPWDFVQASATESETVDGLRAHPPDFVIVISNDLRPFGIQRYGVESNRGRQMMEWVDENYETVSVTGGNPLDYRERGAVILKRKP